MTTHLEAAQPDAVLAYVLERRYSCRAFTPDPVPNETIARLLQLSQRAASWCNSQAWEVIVTRGEGTERFRDALFSAGQSQAMQSDIPEPAAYHGVYQDRRRAAGFGLYGSLGIARDDLDGRRKQLLENFRLFGAPHAAIITSDRDLGPYGYIDCGGYVSTFLTAAESLGINTVAQAAIAMHSDVVREHFSIPDSRVIVCGISFGYEQKGHPANGFRTGREHVEAVATFVD